MNDSNVKTQQDNDKNVDGGNHKKNNLNSYGSDSSTMGVSEYNAI